MATKDSEQYIFRGKHKSHFSIVPNSLMEHGGLSIETKGLQVYFLSRPQNWKIRPKHLAARLRIGRDRLQRMMRELIDAGFIERKRVRKAGKFVGMNYFVHDVAIEPQPEKPLTAEPATAEPATAFQADYKEQKITKEDSEQATALTRGAPPQRPSPAAGAAGSGEGSKRPCNPSLAQARLAERFGLGNVEDGWLILGAMPEAELSRLTALELAGRLDIQTIREAILRVRAAAVAATVQA